MSQETIVDSTAFREDTEHRQKLMFCIIESMDPPYAKEIEEG